MSPASKLVAVDVPKSVPGAPAQKRYIPVCSETERRAYAAAHKLLQLSASGERELACPGARRSVYLDRVAAVIAAEFGEKLPNTH